MIKKYSVSEARDRFSSVVQEAEEGATIEITRRGRTVAVLLGVEDYERRSCAAPRFWEAYEKFRRDLDLSDLGADLEDLRDSSPGRDFEW